MRSVIQSIIQQIKTNYIFDAHTIIAFLIQNNCDLYLTSFGDNTSTELYHSEISKMIASFEDSLITRIGNSWSKNVKDNFSTCVCWRKN